MAFRTALIVVLVGLAAVQWSCVPFSQGTKDPSRRPEPIEGCGTLDKLPFKEGWYGMYFQEEKIGYSHFKIVPAGKTFEISTDATMRFKTKKRVNEIRMTEKTVVKPDLSLVSLVRTERQNEKELSTHGKVVNNTLVVDFLAEGEKMHHEFPLKGPVYHTGATGLMPGFKGLRSGAAYRFQVFNPAVPAVDELTQEISEVLGRPGPNDAVWKVRSTLARRSDDSWYDRTGRCVLEKLMDGALIVIAEDEKAATKFVQTHKPDKDMALYAGFIESGRAIDHPESLRVLKLRIQGAKTGLFPEDHRQKVVNRSDGVEVEVRREDPAKYGRAQSGSRPDHSPKDLEHSAQVQTDHPEIVQAAQKVVSPRDSDLEKVTKLVKWTSEKIRYSDKESFSATSVLRAAEGECQAHAKLYTALARSQKIPTRMVTGLVYVTQGGFLSRKAGFAYHAWAESYVNGWLALDPTTNQVPADATHIKLTTGEPSEKIGSLLGARGKIKVEVIDAVGGK